MSGLPKLYSYIIYFTQWRTFLYPSEWPIDKVGGLDPSVCPLVCFDPAQGKHDAAQRLHPVASCLWVTVESYDRAKARTLWHAQTDIHGPPTLAMNIVKLTVVTRK